MRGPAVTSGEDLPLVLPLDHPDLRRTVRGLAGGGQVLPLGGTMSRNVHLVDAGLVLRVHAPFVSAGRVRAERRLRRRLLASGLVAPRPERTGGRELLEVAGRVAELERYVPHRTGEPGWDSYRAMLRVTARIHRALSDQPVPRPVISSYGAPGTLARQLALLRRRELSPWAREQLREVASVLRRLRVAWVPARDLPLTVVHGDVRPENLPVGDAGRDVVLDLGFAARRPRVHDLAYAAAWILLGPDDAGLDLAGQLPGIRSCLHTYEDGASIPLSALERRAFAGYLAGVCLHQSTVAAYVSDPDAHLAQPGPRRMVEIARWALDHGRPLSGHP